MVRFRRPRVRQHLLPGLLSPFRPLRRTLHCPPPLRWRAPQIPLFLRLLLILRPLRRLLPLLALPLLLSLLPPLPRLHPPALLRLLFPLLPHLLVLPLPHLPFLPLAPSPLHRPLRLPLP